MKIWLDICPWTLSVPRSSQFSTSYALGKLFASRNRQLMSADKYPSIFSCQMEAAVYLFQIFDWLSKLVTVWTGSKLLWVQSNGDEIISHMYVANSNYNNFQSPHVREIIIIRIKATGKGNCFMQFSQICHYNFGYIAYFIVKFCAKLKFRRCSLTAK